MKKVSSMWFIPSVCMLVFSAFLSESSDNLNKMTCVENRKFKQLESHIHGYDKHKDFLSFHADNLNYVDISEFKESIKCVANMSVVSEVKINKISDEKNVRIFDLQITSTSEEAGYRFVYFMERIFSGIVDIEEMLVDKNNDVFVVNLKGKIHYFDIKLNIPKRNPIENEEMCVYAITEDMKKNCEFAMFRKKLTYKLDGIVGKSAVVNKKAYQVGDKIADYTLEKVARSNIALRSDSGRIKYVDLGRTF